MSFDPAPYHQFLNDCDWTQAQKNEFINELWTIIVGFVDLGFDLHPVQQVLNVIETLEVDSGDMLDFGNTPKMIETTSAAFSRKAEAGRPDS